MLKKMLYVLGVALLVLLGCALWRDPSPVFHLLKPIAEVKAAAEQGEAKAQYNLGVKYAMGYGVRQDYDEALKWYEKSAAQGYASAQFKLGVMYHNGQGVRQNKRTAKEWYGKACDNGNQRGCDEYRKLNEAGF